MTPVKKVTLNSIVKNLPSNQFRDLTFFLISEGQLIPLMKGFHSFWTNLLSEGCPEVARWLLLIPVALSKLTVSNLSIN